MASAGRIAVLQARKWQEANEFEIATYFIHTEIHNKWQLFKSVVLDKI